MVTAPVRIVTNIATGDEKDESLADIAKKEDLDCGFYLVLPLIGPSNLRDTVADTAGYAANPVAQVTVLSAGDAVDKRIRGEARIKQLDGALDKYAMARSASMQGRGCLVVEDADAPTAKEARGKIDVTTEFDDNGELYCIRVHDTGGGMPEGVMAKVFDPFFTTKEVGVGTGLGLSVSYGIINSMGGTITASNIGAGCEMTVELPVSNEVENEGSDASESASAG